MSRPSLPRTLLTARDFQKLTPPERANIRELEKLEQQAAQELLDLRMQGRHAPQDPKAAAMRRIRREAIFNQIENLLLAVARRQEAANN